MTLQFYYPDFRRMDAVAISESWRVFRLPLGTLGRSEEQKAIAVRVAAKPKHRNWGQVVSEGFLISSTIG
jgi:hypothetical protein